MKPPLPPEKKEELARDLRQKLRSQRPRTALWLILATILVIGVLSFIWFNSRTTRDWPQLLLVGYDGVSQVGEPCDIQARLQAVDDPNGPLDEHEIFWRVPNDDAQATKTDRKGATKFKLPASDLEAILAIHVYHIDPAKRYRRDDAARLFVVDPAQSLLLVPIEAGLIAEKQVEWGRSGAESPMIRPGAIKEIADQKAQPVYLVDASHVWDYRGARGWLQAQIAQGLADGPLLVNIADAAKTSLQKTFGPDRAIVWEPK